MLDRIMEQTSSFETITFVESDTVVSELSNYPIVVLSPSSEGPAVEERQSLDNSLPVDIRLGGFTTRIYAQAVEIDSLQNLRDELNTALAGFIPYDGAFAIAWSGGDMAEMRGNIWVWDDAWEVAFDG